MDHPFQIETRQKEETLFYSIDRVLVPSGSMQAGPFEVDGYSAVIFFAISDQPFQLRVQEAVQSSGPFTETTTLSSSLDPITGFQKLMYKIQPSGDFMRAFLDNLGASAEQFLQFRMAGLPVAGNLATGAGQSGYSGMQGASGYSGAPSVSGFSGYSGVGGPGASGFSGYSGYSGTGASATPEAATFVVSPIPGVGDFLTIQDAITAVIPLGGGYILVREGTYDMTAATTNAIPADIPIVIRGCGDATILNFGSNAIAAFTFPNGYTQRTNYILADFKAIFDATAGQDFIEIADAGGYVSVDVYNCSIYRPATLVNFSAYDLSFTRPNSVRFNGGNAIPLTGVSKLVETPFPAGTYNGFVWVGFQDTILDDDYGFAEWTFDADCDIIVSGTGSSGFFSISAGSKCDGFAFDGNILFVGNGDFTAFGAAFGGSYFLARIMSGGGGNARIICTDIGSRVQGYVVDLCFQVGFPSPTFPSSQFLGVWFVNTVANVMANPAVEMLGNAGVMSDCFFQARYVNGCIKITDSKFCKIHDCNFTTSVTGKTIIESGTSDQNDIHDNTGMSNGTGYTIIGPLTEVDGAQKADKASTTTNALVEIVSTITNPKGLIGTGVVKNTDGVNTLSVTESFTDAFGTTSTLTTDVLPGNYLLLGLEQAIGTGLPPYVSYKAEVIDKVPGSHATYESHFTSQSPIQ